MKPVLFLRIASVLAFIHAALHTIGAVFGSPQPGPQQVALLAMKANPFPVMGVTRTYLDFEQGLGWAVTIFLLVEAVVFWQLGSLTKTSALPLRPVFAAFMIGYAGMAVVAFLYIFAAPAITEILIAACLGLAIATSKPASLAHP